MDQVPYAASVEGDFSRQKYEKASLALDRLQGTMDSNVLPMQETGDWVQVELAHMERAMAIETFEFPPGWDFSNPHSSRQRWRLKYQAIVIDGDAELPLGYHSK